MSIIYSRAYRQAILSQRDTTGDRMSPSATRFGRMAGTLCILIIDFSCDDQESGNKMVLANDATGLDLRSRSVDCACLRRPGQGPQTPDLRSRDLRKPVENVMASFSLISMQDVAIYQAT